MKYNDKLLEIFTVKELMQLLLTVDYAVNNVDENTSEDDIQTLKSLQEKLYDFKAFDLLYEKGLKNGIKLVLETDKNCDIINNIKAELNV